jgi:Tol biopolymer transport system component
MNRLAVLILAAVLLVAACGDNNTGTSATQSGVTTLDEATTSAVAATSEETTTSMAAPEPPPRPPDRWAIHALDLTTGQTDLVYSTPNEIEKLRVNDTGDRIAFAQMVGGDTLEDTEIFTIGVDGSDLHRLTDNDVMDLYPAWSPDGSTIAFLTSRGANLDIYTMNADGADQQLLFDSGTHDADIHWRDDLISFTSGSRIWLMASDGSDARPLTDPPRAGEWGNAVLPFGDYDPRISPDGSRVVFSRLVDDESEHGNYDLFVVGVDGTDLTRLTETGYTQGVAAWSHDGERLVYIVAAADGVGRYDMYMMNADGTGNHNATPDCYPEALVIHWAVFSPDDTKIYFVGEWW